MRLPRAVKHVSPACLPVTSEFTSGPDPDSVLNGVRCFATGWGQTVFGGDLDNNLREVELTVTENDKCAEVYADKYGIGIDKYHLCAGPTAEEDGKGTCVVSGMETRMELANF
jgi:hypothetical protein